MIHDMQPVYEPNVFIRDSEKKQLRLHVCSSCGFRWVISLDLVPFPPIPEEPTWLIDCDAYKVAGIMET